MWTISVVFGSPHKLDNLVILILELSVKKYFHGLTKRTVTESAMVMLTMMLRRLLIQHELHGEAYEH